MKLNVYFAGWIRSIRENNSDIRIVPRFLFDGWSPDDVQTLLTDERVQERCIKSVIGFLQVCITNIYESSFRSHVCETF
jgi:uncharacterized protein (DUF488 family)